MKPFLKAHWADMKQHAQYNDPVRNSSFNPFFVLGQANSSFNPLKSA